MELWFGWPAEICRLWNYEAIDLNWNSRILHIGNKISRIHTIHITHVPTLFHSALRTKIKRKSPSAIYVSLTGALSIPKKKPIQSGIFPMFYRKVRTVRIFFNLIKCSPSTLTISVCNVYIFLLYWLDNFCSGGKKRKAKKRRNHFNFPVKQVRRFHSSRSEIVHTENKQENSFNKNAIYSNLFLLCFTRQIN